MFLSRLDVHFHDGIAHLLGIAIANLNGVDGIHDPEFNVLLERADGLRDVVARIFLLGRNDSAAGLINDIIANLIVRSGTNAIYDIFAFVLEYGLLDEGASLFAAILRS